MNNLQILKGGEDFGEIRGNKQMGQTEGEEIFSKRNGS